MLKVHYPKFGVSEDCLYLNIYAPAHADAGSKLPVRLPAVCFGLQLARPWPGIQAVQLHVWNWNYPLLGKREM